LQRIGGGGRGLLHASNDDDQLAGGVETRGGRVAPPFLRGMAPDQALDQVPLGVSALRAYARFLPGVRLCGLRGHQVHGLHREPGQMQGRLAWDLQARRRLSCAGVPKGEQRRTIGMLEILKTDVLMDASASDLSHDLNVLAAQLDALCERRRKQLAGGRGTGEHILQQVRRAAPIARDLLNDATGHRSAELVLLRLQRLADLANCYEP
jgi:hypothetical protein